MKLFVSVMLISSSSFSYGQRAEGEGIMVIAEDAIQVYGEVYKQPESETIILLFHQAGSNAKAEYSSHIIPRLLHEGFSVIAVDQRKGGSSLGGVNRTAKQVDESALSYCDAYPDLEATLKFATENFNQKIIVWGSSYSAALVYKLAAKHPGDIQGILAFSPASGKAMGDCNPGPFLKDIKSPSLAFRPGREASGESVQNQIITFKSFGIETYVSAQGVHGSSMLNPDRAKGGVEETWGAVLAFLAKI